MKILDIELSKLFESYYYSLPVIVTKRVEFKNINKHSNFQYKRMTGLYEPQKNGTFYVWVNITQPINEYEISLAHELTHCVMFQENYPQTFRSLEYLNNIPVSYIGSYLSSCILDVEINRKLEKFGFDVLSKNLLLLEKNRKNLIIKKRSLEIEKNQNLYHLRSCELILDYINTYLSYSMNKRGSYQKTFKSLFPMLIEKVNKLIDTVKDADLKTPNNCRDVMKVIVKKLNLVEYVIVR